MPQQSLNTIARRQLCWGMVIASAAAIVIGCGGGGGGGGGTSSTGGTGGTTGGPGPTTTAVVSSLNPATVSQNVTFTATVAAKAPAVGVPSGSVAFTDGATALATVAVDGSGQAAYNTSALAMGRHTITGTFTGSSGWTGSGGSVVESVGNGGWGTSTGTSTIFFSMFNGVGNTVEQIQPSVSLTPSTVANLVANIEGFGWTFDGNKVAYGYTSNPAAASPVYGIWEGPNAVKANGMRVTNDLYSFVGSVWLSNDETQVFFTAVDTLGNSILVSGVPGTSSVTLDTNAEDMALDPTGKTIVYTKFGVSLAEIWTMNVDGSGKTQLTSDGSVDKFAPEYSSDGSKIVFCGRSGGVGAENVYTMSSAGGAATNVTNGLIASTDSAIGAAFNPSADKLAYALLSTNTSASGLYTIGTNGSGNASMYLTPSINQGVVWMNGGAGPLVVTKSLSGGSASGSAGLGLRRILRRR